MFERNETICAWGSFGKFLDWMIVIYSSILLYLINDTFRYMVNDTYHAIDYLIWRLGVIF